MSTIWISFLMGVVIGIITVMVSIVVIAIIANKKYPDPINDEDEG